MLCSSNRKLGNFASLWQSNAIAIPGHMGDKCPENQCTCIAPNIAAFLIFIKWHIPTRNLSPFQSWQNLSLCLLVISEYLSFADTPNKMGGRDLT